MLGQGIWVCVMEIGSHWNFWAREWHDQSCCVLSPDPFDPWLLSLFSIPWLLWDSSWPALHLSQLPWSMLPTIASPCPSSFTSQFWSDSGFHSAGGEDGFPWLVPTVCPKEESTWAALVCPLLGTGGYSYLLFATGYKQVTASPCGLSSISAPRCPLMTYKSKQKLLLL